MFAENPDGSSRHSMAYLANFSPCTDSLCTLTFHFAIEISIHLVQFIHSMWKTYHPICNWLFLRKCCCSISLASPSIFSSVLRHSLFTSSIIFHFNLCSFVRTNTFRPCESFGTFIPSHRRLSAWIATLNCRSYKIYTTTTEAAEKKRTQQFI